MATLNSAGEHQAADQQHDPPGADVFVRDPVAGTTTRVSVASSHDFRVPP